MALGKKQEDASVMHDEDWDKTGNHCLAEWQTTETEELSAKQPSEGEERGATFPINMVLNTFISSPENMLR